MNKPSGTPTHHYLLTSLGIRPKPTTYSLKGKQSESAYSPLALLQLLLAEQRPDTVLCLTTTQVLEDRVFDCFKNEAVKLGVEVESLLIPEGDDDDEISMLIDKVSQRIESQAHLMLEITHGLRHIPFVFYALALYLTALRGVHITGVWYGKLESQRVVKPLLDLKALIELPQWFYAIHVMQDTGHAHALAERFDMVRKSFLPGKEQGLLKKMQESLQDLTFYYTSALPMELGLAAGKVACILQQQKPLGYIQIPLRDELGTLVEEAVEPLRFQEDDLRDGKGSGEWKNKFTLTQKELQRQAKLIDCFLNLEQIPQAYGLMREWVVSLAALHRNKASLWLDHKTRMRLERELGALKQTDLMDQLDDEQKEWGQFWNRLSLRRNHLAHHSMNPENVGPEIDENIRRFWDRVKCGNKCWLPFGGGFGMLLLTPLGLSSGVLYSALLKTRPDRALVLCSDQSSPAVAEACDKVRFPVERVKTIVMHDPNDFDGIIKIKKQARNICLAADKLVINLTGGTTIMGIAVQQIEEQARNDLCPCRRFVLLDDRSAELQRQEPWCEATLRWLEPSDGRTEDA